MISFHLTLTSPQIDFLLCLNSDNLKMELSSPHWKLCFLTCVRLNLVKNIALTLKLAMI